MDIPALILRLCNVSPSAKEYIDGNQSVINTDEDDVTTAITIDGAVDKLIGDLSDLGVELICTRDDICGNYESIEYLIYLAELIMPNALYDILKQNSEIKIAFQSIMDGSISDDYPIIAILQYFGYYNEQYIEAYGPMVHFFESKIQSTEVFNSYINSMLVIDDKITDLNEIGIKRVSDYIVYMTQIITTMYRNAGDLAMQLKDESLAVRVSKIIHRTMHLFMNSQNLNHYSWLFLLPESTELNEFEISLKQKFSDEISKTIPFYPEYYIIQNSQLSNSDIILLILFAASMNNTRANFTKVALEINEKMRNAKLLTNEYITFFEKVFNLVEGMMNYGA